MSQAQDILMETSGFAAFAAAETTADNGRLQIHGIIAGEGDISKGLSGKWTRWPADVLRDAADRGVFDGKPITIADSLDPEQHVGVEQTPNGLRLTGAVPMESKVGEIEETAYEDGVGLVFSGFISDPYAEDLVERGLAQTSPVLAREALLLEDHDEDIPEDRDLYEATEIKAARDVALVADGGFPSNEINPGSGAIGAMMAEAMSSHFGFEAGQSETTISRPDWDGTSDADWDAPTLEGTFDGDMDDARNSATFIRGDGESFGDLSLFIVDGEGQLNTSALDSAWTLAPQTDGVTDGDVDELRSMYVSIAEDVLSEDEFDEQWADRDGASETEAAAADPLVTQIAGQSDPTSSETATEAGSSDPLADLILRSD